MKMALSGNGETITPSREVVTPADASWIIPLIGLTGIFNSVANLESINDKSEPVSSKVE